MFEIKDWRNVFYLKEAWKHPEVWWTKFPVARASTSYRRLMATRDGHTAFAVFIGLLRIVQRGKTLGVLSLKGKAIEAIDVAAETGIPLKMCEAGMALLKSDAIGWLVEQGTQQIAEAREDGEQPAENRLSARAVLLSARQAHPRPPEGGGGDSAPLPGRYTRLGIAQQKG